MEQTEKIKNILLLVRSGENEASENQEIKTNLTAPRTSISVKPLRLQKVARRCASHTDIDLEKMPISGTVIYNQKRVRTIIQYKN